MKAIDRQREIYLGKVKGYTSSIPFTFDELEITAKSNMSKSAFAYVRGGAGEQATISNNRKAFDSLKLVPKMMHGISAVDTKIELFGSQLSHPFMLAPIGVLEMMHRDADLAVARACEKEDVGMIYSNQASIPMEACAKEMPQSPKWFQLYWSKSNELVESLVSRAEISGCTAIVVTLDTTLLGWRTQDLNLAHLPFLDGLGIAQYTSDPIFKALVKSATINQADQKLNLKSLTHFLKLSWNLPGGLVHNLKTKEALKMVQTFISIYSRPDLRWEDLKWLKSITSLPIILKGVLSSDDVRHAIDHGADGVIISNHGGRQVDGSISSLEALQNIQKNWNDEIPLLLDSGIRNGSDILKALACGAKSVLIGRPYAYALAVAGQQGVTDLIKNLKADFELAMILCGIENVAGVNDTCLS